jgi:hypothetical protein
MATKRVKGNLTIRVSLVPGRCRWCQCTDAKPCTENCSWVDRTHTLCSECWPFDYQLQTAKGRQAIVVFLQAHWPVPITKAHR